MWERNRRLVSSKWASKNRRLTSEHQKGNWALRKEKVREKWHFMTLSPSRKFTLCFLVMEIVISPILQLIIILLLHSLVFEVVGVEGIIEERIGE